MRAIRQHPLLTSRRADFAVATVLFAWALPNVPWWWRPPGHGGSTPSVLGYFALAVLQSAPFLWRRQHPVSIAAAIAALTVVRFELGGDKTSVLVAAVVAAYGVGAFTETGRSWARRAGVVTLAVAAVAAFETHRPVVGMPIVMLGAGFLGGEASAARRRETERAVEAAHLAERARIARELHDVLAHQLTAIAVQAGSARVALDVASQDAAARVDAGEVLGVVEKLAREAMGELGQMLGALRSGPDDVLARRPAPGLRDLEHLVDAGRAAGLDVSLRMRGPVRMLPAAADLGAYRIVQESVTNAARHAPGASTLISVSFDADQLRIDVVNGPGRGPGGVAGSGRGLVGMRERAELHGGSLRAGRRTDGGFEVSASLPLVAAA